MTIKDELYVNGASVLPHKSVRMAVELVRRELILEHIQITSSITEPRIVMCWYSDPPLSLLLMCLPGRPSRPSLASLLSYKPPYPARNLWYMRIIIWLLAMHHLQPSRNDSGSRAVDNC